MRDGHRWKRATRRGGWSGRRCGDLYVGLRLIGCDQTVSFESCFDETYLHFRDEVDGHYQRTPCSFRHPRSSDAILLRNVMRKGTIIMAWSERVTRAKAEADRGEKGVGMLVSSREKPAMSRLCQSKFL